MSSAVPPSETTREASNAPGLKMPQWISLPGRLWVGNYTQASTHVHTFCITTRTVQQRETQIHSDSFFFLPPRKKNAVMYVCFSIFSSPFLFFSEDPQPLASTLSLSYLLVLSPVRMETDRSWHDGGIVLTIELMWPRGMLALQYLAWWHTMHCGKKVGKAKKGEKGQGENSWAWR